MKDENSKTEPLPDKQQVDRRRHPRNADVVATAVVMAESGYVGPFVVENLSAGGALLIGDPRFEPGDRVKLGLHLEGQRPISLAGEIVRHQVRESGDHVFAVAFRNVRPSSEDRIQRAVLSVLERCHTSPDASVLVVDDSPQVHRALELDLRALGRGMLSAATPLEVVRHLQDPKVGIEVAIVDLCLGPADGIEVLAFLAEDHPKIRRVLMSGQVRPCQLELALSSGRAHQVLPKPWERQRLATILRPL